MSWICSFHDCIINAIKFETNALMVMAVFHDKGGMRTRSRCGTAGYSNKTNPPSR